MSEIYNSNDIVRKNRYACMKWINYHHLIYFKEIAKSGSISAASKYLKVGQPALSAQLKQLEESIGLRLFERVGKKLVLTDPGKVALEYAEKIGDLGQELVQVLYQKSFSKKIKLSVGAQDAVPKHIVSSVLDYTHKRTGCYLSIMEGPPDYLIRELENHQLDLLITDHNILNADNRNIFCKSLVKCKVGAYGSKEFLHLKDKFPKSLESAPVIFPTSHSRLRADLEHYFHLQKIYVDKIAETQDSMLQKILSTKGDGIVFLPDIAVKELIAEKKLYFLGHLSNVFIDYYLIYYKRIIGNDAIDILVSREFKTSDFL